MKDATVRKVLTYRRGVPMVIPDEVIERAGIGDGDRIEVELHAVSPTVVRVASAIRGREVTDEELDEIRRRARELQARLLPRRDRQTRALSPEEQAEALREHGVSSVEELPPDADVTVGSWEEILADGKRRVAEARKRAGRLDQEARGERDG